jgi:preprotein translocase subunit SecY
MKLLRYVMYFLIIVGALYIGSLINGRNIFPKNVYIVPLTTAGWSVILILSAIADYLMVKSKQNKNGGNRR